MKSLRFINTENVLLAIVTWCIYSFKISLFGVGDAGLRPDDFMIIVAFAILVLHGALTSTRLSKPLKAYLLFVAASILSSIWNGAVGRVSFLYSLLFDVRLLQYLVFYFLGYYLAQRGRDIRKIIVVYFYLMVLVIPLQLLNLLPTINSFGSSRASGNTNGPYELAVVAGFLLCYLGYLGRSLFEGFTSVIFVVLSASRATFVAIIVSFFSYLLRWSRRSLQSAVIGACILLITSFFCALLFLSGNLLVNSNIELLSRVGGGITGTSSQSFIEGYRNAPIYTVSADYIAGTFLNSCDYGQCDDGAGDASGNIRREKWTALIKSTVASLDSTILGLGPSFASTAVDGYFIRVFVESGALGSVFFCFAMASFWERRSAEYWAFREYLIIMLVSAVFIDIFTSYKPMILLWLWHGINEGMQNKTSALNSKTYPVMFATSPDKGSVRSI
jgi:hypothetical protein